MARIAGSTRELTTAALIAALMAASAPLSLPIGPVPITLQMMFVMLAALLLRPAWAAMSMGVYVLMGAIGLPVYAGLTGGFSHLIGPTGGYLWGFIAAAAIGSWIRVTIEHRGVNRIAGDLAAIAAAVLVVYALGIAQLMLVTSLGGAGLSLPSAFLVGALPFLPGEIVKGVLAIGVAEALVRTGIVPAGAKSTVVDPEAQPDSGAA